MTLVCRDPFRWRGLEMTFGGDWFLTRSSSVRVRGRGCGCDPEALPTDVSCRSLLCDEDSTDGVRIRRGAAGRGYRFRGDMGDPDSDSESDLSAVVLTGLSGVVARIVRSLKSSGYT